MVFRMCCLQVFSRVVLVPNAPHQPQAETARWLLWTALKPRNEPLISRSVYNQRDGSGLTVECGRWPVTLYLLWKVLDVRQTLEINILRP